MERKFKKTKEVVTLMILFSLGSLYYTFFSEKKTKPINIPTNCQLVYTSNSKQISKLDAQMFENQNKEGQYNKLPEELGLKCDCDDNFEDLSVHSSRNDRDIIEFNINHGRNGFYSTIFYYNTKKQKLEYITKYGIEMQPTLNDLEKWEHIKGLAKKIFEN